MKYRLLLTVAIVVGGSGSSRTDVVSGSGRTDVVSGFSRTQDDVLSRIRQAGLDRSQVQALFATLTDQFGPRLAGTTAERIPRP